MAEFRIQHMVQTVQKSLVHEGVEEIHLLGSILQHILNDIFQHGLRKIHVVVQIRESTLRLNHPELRRVTGGIGILRAEGRPEGIDIAEGLGICLAVELSAYRQVRLLAEEILAVIYIALLVQRRILGIQCSHTEHLARALAVASGDQRRVHIDEASLLEEFMDGVCAQGTHAEHCLESIGPRS